MPKSFKQQFGNVVLVVVITLVVVAVIVGAILYFMGVLKLPGKSTSTSPASSDDVQVELKKEYKNPFDKSTQYQNPFEEYQNPFDQLK